MIDIDRAKAADLGLTQADVIQNVVAALNSSIQFNKKNFWIDPVSHNQYFVGVQYPEADIRSVETLLNIPITSPTQPNPVPLRNVATIHRTQVPAEVNHTTLQATIDLTMGVSGRDLGHVADDVARVIDRFGKLDSRGVWEPYEVDKNHKPIPLSAAIDVRSVRGHKIDSAAAASEIQAAGRRKAGAGGRILADAGHVQQSFHRARPRFALDVLPDGGARQIVGRPVYRHVYRAPLAGGRDSHAVSHGNGPQCAVPAGDHLHRRHQSGEYGSLERFRAGTSPPRRTLRPRRRFAKRPRSACGP